MATPNNQRLRLFSTIFNLRLFATGLIAATVLIAHGQGISLNDALDDNLVWSVRTNDVAWFGEPIISHDGVSAVQVGPISDAYWHTTQLSTTITGPAIVSFWWKVSDALGYADVGVIVNNSLAVLDTGAMDWTYHSVTIGEGEHKFTWNASLYGPSPGTVWLDTVKVLPVVAQPPVISAQPQSQTVKIQEPIVLSVAATGTPTLAYQWYHNGSYVFGARQSTLAIFDAQFSDAGTYSVSVENIFGSMFSDSVVVTVSSLPLDESLDVTNMHWEDVSAGISHWFGQSSVTFDGVDAVESATDPFVDATDRVLRSTVTGPARFEWTVKMAGGSPGFFSQSLLLLVDGQVNKSYTGGTFDWTHDQLDIPVGTHQVEWRNVPAMYDPGQVWLDQFSLTPLSGDPPIITSQPQSITIAAGGHGELTVGTPSGIETPTVSLGGLSMSTNLLPPLDVRWLFNGNTVHHGSVLEFTNVRPVEAGSYVAVVSNLFGEVTSSAATVNVPVTISLSEALNATNLIWQTPTGQPWFADSFESHDGIAAVQGGGATNSWLDTIVVGPGLLTFWTKSVAMSWSFYYTFHFSDNGQQLQQFPYVLDTSGDWQKQKIPIGSGTHHLRFQSIQPSFIPGPWIDEVKFTPANPPKIVVAPRDQFVAAGGKATFCLVASSPLPMSYQWHGWYGLPIEGATNATLVIDDVNAFLSPGYYYCTIDNGFATATTGARLVINDKLTKVLGKVAVSYSTGPEPWTVQRDPTFGLVLQTPKLPDNGYSILTTTVTGPGWLTFWW
ncbi:MAG: immunoglobulin domain-containing protein, partial [Limisphaerales bacterium]